MKKTDNSSKQPIEHGKKNYITWIVKNLVVLAVAVGVLYYVFDVAKGYNWTYNNLLRKNFTYITKYPKLNFDQKMISKFGASYEYLMHLRMQTPKSAVILFPENKDFRVEGSPFQAGELADKRSAIRFLYPRKLVLGSELDKSAYADKITHIAIVNGIGFDKVPYEVKEKFSHGILPVTPKANN